MSSGFVEHDDHVEASKLNSTPDAPTNHISPAATYSPLVSVRMTALVVVFSAVNCTGFVSVPDVDTCVPSTPPIVPGSLMMKAMSAPLGGIGCGDGLRFHREHTAGRPHVDVRGDGVGGV